MKIIVKARGKYQPRGSRVSIKNDSKTITIFSNAQKRAKMTHVFELAMKMTAAEQWEWQRGDDDADWSSSKGDDSKQIENVDGSDGTLETRITTSNDEGDWSAYRSEKRSHRSCQKQWWYRRSCQKQWWYISSEIDKWAKVIFTQDLTKVTMKDSCKPWRKAMANSQYGR